MSGYTQSQLDELKANFAKGVTSLSRNGEQVQFRSLSEMQQLITKIESELSTTLPNRQHYPQFSRGT